MWCVIVESFEDLPESYKMWWREDTDGDLADRTVADGNVAVDDVS